MTFYSGVWQLAIGGDAAPGTSVQVAGPSAFGARLCPYVDAIASEPSGNLLVGGVCGDVFELANLGGSPASFAPPTVFASLAGTYEVAGVASDGAGNYAFSQYSGGQITLVHGDVISPSHLGTGLNYPRGLAYDASGNLFVAGGGGGGSAPNALRHAHCSVAHVSNAGGTITRVDPSGNAVLIASGLGLGLVMSVAIDQTGNLFATTPYTGSVIEIPASLAGPSLSASETSSARNGTSITATWSGPSGATSFTCTLLYGFDAPSSFTETTTSHACTFSGLNAHALYGVRVLAHFPSGATTVTTTFASAIQVLDSRIVCVRGTSHRVVVGLNPRCPAGWHQV